MISQSPKLAFVLERLSYLADKEGFALFGPDGTLLFSRFEGSPPSEVLLAIAEIIEVANGVALGASASDLNQMQVEWQDSVLLIHKHPDRGFHVVLLGGKKLNVGLAKILIKEITPALEEIFDALKLPAPTKETS
jgi:predicted regulator of Ras-like GTPase activity (Roadblock/LC7/MglB family)